MKKLLLSLIIFTSLGVKAQTYIAGSFSYYNGPGTFREKGMATFEVGRTIKEVLSLGVAGGWTSFSGWNKYIEFRPTLTVWSKNGISLAGTVGVGKVFDSPESFLTEYCATVSYGLGKSFSISGFVGEYTFDGKTTSSDFMFLGTGITYSFVK